MSISYNRLWKLLIDKKMNKARLCKATGISSSTMDKLVKDENVELKTLASICKELDCDFVDIVEYIKDEPTVTDKHSRST